MVTTTNDHLIRVQEEEEALVQVIQLNHLQHRGNYLAILKFTSSRYAQMQVINRLSFIKVTGLGNLHLLATTPTWSF